MAHRHGMIGRMLAMTLAMIMIVTSLPQTAMTAYAAEEDANADAVANGAVDEASSEDAVIGAPADELGGV